MNDATQKKGVSQGKTAAPNRTMAPESDAVFDNPGDGADNPIDPKILEATHSESDEPERPRNPRDDVIDRIHARVEAGRQDDVAEARALGAQAPEPAAEEAEPAAAVEPEDELEQFTVMKDGKLMFKTVVNGNEILIPLKRAQEQLQKGEAAEVRMSRAAEYEKGLKVKENQILAREQALVTKTGAPNAATPPGTPGEGDPRVREEELLVEARQLVNSLLTGTDEQAAAQMAKVLANSRRLPIQAPVNPDELVQRAVKAVQQKLSEEETTKDSISGYKKFETEYPEVITDSNLYRYADSLTTTIAEENPSWKPSEVMLEAGKRTREWVQSLKTSEPEKAPSQNPNQDRQTRKGNLVPMPRQASTRKESERNQDPVETPQSMFAEIRRGRGQAV